MDPSIRKAGNMSRFYPGKSDDIDKMIEKWEYKLSQTNDFKDQSESVHRIAIVPHAGFIYSGYTAYLAYKALQKSKFTRIIVAGPSHHVYFNGISIAMQKSFETPYGFVEIDQDYNMILKSKYNVSFIENVHTLEHSTENQMPFIKKIFPDTRIIELVYGDVSNKTLHSVFAFILENTDNCLIISTDLSHFHNLRQANSIDKYTIEALLEENFEALEKNGEACGKKGLIAISEYCKNKALKIKLLDYRTSADVTADDSRVVGYMSAVI
jgi:hypothetical protein